MMKQARSEARKQARIKRLEKAAELQMTLEDRAAARRLLAELAEADRAHRRWAARFQIRMRPDEPETQTSPVKKRPKSRSILTARLTAGDRPASSWTVDDHGMRGVIWQQTYLGRNSPSFYPGAARDNWEYEVRDEAVVRDAAGEPIIISNMGDDWIEIGAAWQVMEDASVRKNAKIQIRAIAPFDADMRLEEMTHAVRHFCKTVLAPLGLPYSAVIHAPPEGGDERNFHPHISFSLRPMRRVAPYCWDVADEVRGELDGRDGVQMLRHLWAHAMSEAAEQARRNMSYTGLGYGARGLNLEAGEHLGEAKSAMATRGTTVLAAERNRIRNARNAARLAIRDADHKIAALTRIRDAVVNQMEAERLPRASRRLTAAMPAPDRSEILRPSIAVDAAPMRAAAPSAGTEARTIVPAKASTTAAAAPLRLAATTIAPSRLEPAATIRSMEVRLITGRAKRPFVITPKLETMNVGPSRPAIRASETKPVLAALPLSTINRRGAEIPRGTAARTEPITPLVTARDAEDAAGIFRLQSATSVSAKRERLAPAATRQTDGASLMIASIQALLLALAQWRKQRAETEQEALTAAEQKADAAIASQGPAPVKATVPEIAQPDIRRETVALADADAGHRDAPQIVPPAIAAARWRRARLIRAGAGAPTVHSPTRQWLETHPREVWTVERAVAERADHPRGGRQVMEDGVQQKRRIDPAAPPARTIPDGKPSQPHIAPRDVRGAGQGTPIPDGFGGTRTTPPPPHEVREVGARVLAFDKGSGRPSQALLALLGHCGEHPHDLAFASDGRLTMTVRMPPLIEPLIPMWRNDSRVEALVVETVRASRQAGRPVYPAEHAAAIRALTPPSAPSRRPPSDWDRGPSR